MELRSGRTIGVNSYVMYLISMLKELQDMIEEPEEDLWGDNYMSSGTNQRSCINLL